MTVSDWQLGIFHAAMELQVAGAICSDIARQHYDADPEYAQERIAELQARAAGFYCAARYLLFMETPLP